MLPFNFLFSDNAVLVIASVLWVSHCFGLRQFKRWIPSPPPRGFNKSLSANKEKGTGVDVSEKITVYKKRNSNRQKITIIRGTKLLSFPGNKDKLQRAE